MEMQQVKGRSAFCRTCVLTIKSVDLLTTLFVGSAFCRVGLLSGRPFSRLAFLASRPFSRLTF
jgi:hypothetical protein